MARKLQGALALASYKARNGMDNLAFDTAGDKNAGRKRRASTTISPSSSSSYEPQLFSSPFCSSPIKAPSSSHGIYSEHLEEGPQKRSKIHPRLTYPSPSPRKRTLRQSTAAIPAVESSRNQWKPMHKLPASSPASYKPPVHFPAGHEANASFMSGMSTLPDSPPLGQNSDEESSLQERSFSRDAYSFNAAGPRTPPPTRNRSDKHRKSNPTGEGVRLLLDFASSPSPANACPNRSGMNPPSTPPSKSTALGTSMMTTPQGERYTAAPITPSPAFNIADYLNLTPTPSPAQGAFGSYTPGLPNTPLTAKKPRKKLPDGGIVPIDGSPLVGVSGRRSNKKETGLGMDLGGELLPR